MLSCIYCYYHKPYYIQLHYRVDTELHIKVADFGLARDVYMTEYYRQQSTGKIPAKWMAPESLHDRISNEKTDVVSYLSHTHILHCVHTVVIWDHMLGSV